MVHSAFDTLDCSIFVIVWVLMDTMCIFVYSHSSAAVARKNECHRVEVLFAVYMI